MDHTAQARSQVTIGSRDWPRDWVTMKSVNELLELFMRQAQLERAMKRPGGARVIEEHELRAVKDKLAAIPDALKRSLAVQDP
jgi:hypothetical protein